MNNRTKEYLDIEENFLYENINKLIKSIVLVKFNFQIK